MSGLTEKDLRVMQAYAESGNRERYWNYLAKHPGADGYGVLALGVVRNDNMPGAVANSYAQSYARDHNGVSLDERGWESFGRDLIAEDFKRRALHALRGDAASALNLSAKDIQEVHAQSFDKVGIGADAWTPNILLNAARAAGDEADVEKVWHSMLDDRAIGLARIGNTTHGILAEYGSHIPDRVSYMTDLARAEAEALSASPNVDPDHVRRGVGHYDYDRRSPGWWTYMDTDVAEFGYRTPSERVTDPALIRELNDVRDVRLERRKMAEEVHPDDSYREIVRSPHTIAGANARYAGDIDRTTLARSVDPALYNDLRSRLPKDTSPDRLAQITLAARQADVRAGDVQGISLHRESILIVHGLEPGDRAMIDLSAPPPSIAQTLATHQAHEAQQAQQWAQFQSQERQIEFQAQQQAQMEMQAQAPQAQVQAHSAPAMPSPSMG